jgi:hypothetical protein
MASPAAAPAQPAASPAPPSQPARGRLALLALGAVALLALAAGAVFFLTRSAAPSSEQTAAGPVAPDPGSPPPPPTFTLASATAQVDAAASQTLAALPSAAQRLTARLGPLAGENHAPPETIVRGGGAPQDASPLDPSGPERWELRFPPGTTLEVYARQLDHYQIELGVIGGSPQITYLTNLSNPKPKTRVALAAADTRLYLIWNRGPMHEADEKLVARAGLDPAGKVLAHFCPAAFESALAQAEAEFAQKANRRRIRKTVFEIQTITADSFRIAVIDQQGE